MSKIIVNIKKSTSDDEGKNILLSADNLKTYADLRHVIIENKIPVLKGAWNFLIDDAMLVEKSEKAQLLPVGEDAKTPVRILLADESESEAKANEIEKAKQENAANRAAAESASKAIEERTAATTNWKLDRSKRAVAGFSDMEAMLGQSSGEGSESMLEVPTENLKELVRHFRFPRTLQREPDGTFKVQQFVAQLKSDDKEADIALIVDDYCTSVNEIETSVKYFKTEWETKAYESGFKNISASLSAGFSVFGASVGVSASYDSKSQQESSNSATGTSINLVGVQEIRKMRVHIPSDRIAIAPFVLDKFKKVGRKIEEVKAAQKKNRYEDGSVRDQMQLALLAAEEGKLIAEIGQLLDQYGYFVITDYTIGGKLSTSETREVKGSLQEAASSYTRQFNAAVSGSYGSASLGVSGGQGSGGTNEKSNSKTDEAFGFLLQAKGGKIAERSKAAEWAKSLASNNWDVISYDGLVPIYEFFEDESIRAIMLQKMNDVRDKSVSARKKNRFTASGNEVQQRNAKALETRPDNTRILSELQYYADGEWVMLDDPKTQYFAGLSFYKKGGNRLALKMKVVDAEFNPIKWADNLYHGEIHNENYWFPGLHEGGQFFDTTPLYIPQGKRVIGCRLQRLRDINNRVGIAIKVADYDGVSNIREIYNTVNNQNYTHNGSANCKPTFESVVVDETQSVVGLSLAELEGGTIGLKILVL
jgi:hypothetical protein